ncbi:MAG: tRNA (adenosine(37)-N6)-threonylcarbamoyltransferase complex dimerization subunit type 1 TsaB [Chitinophagales bacterium]|nr:tRNA (adenosine(37)-N6)-threonylcarbamoyltransferase complex dimerization subunit type 1 TsaB [Chitinophagales bacterium]
MAHILNIDTSRETASICLSRDITLLEQRINDNQYDHASWIHTAIADLLQSAGITLQELSAVAVTIGPGSYTGLRVGLATAKGLCYALQLPLITISTLEMMAEAAREQAEELICPMIDARRMEVFAAIYDKNLTIISPPAAIELNNTTYQSFIATHKIVFCGSGSKKFTSFVQSANARFIELPLNSSALIPLAFKRFLKKDFASLAYAEPLYLKEFYTTQRRK